MSIRHLSELPGKLISLVEQEALLDSAGRKHRLESIHANQDPLRRAGALAIHQTSALFANPVKQRQQHLYTSNGFEHIGTGAHSSVLLAADGVHVVKVIRASVRDRSTTRQAQATYLQEIINIAKQCHDDELQTTQVDADFSLTRGKRQLSYVALRQQYVEGVCAFDQPGYRDLLSNFAERSLDTMVPQGLAPDVLGIGNILATPSNSIILVDTVPMDIDDPVARNGGAYDRNLARLRELAHA